MYTDQKVFSEKNLRLMTIKLMKWKIQIGVYV